MKLKYEYFFRLKLQLEITFLNRPQLVQIDAWAVLIGIVGVDGQDSKSLVDDDRLLGKYSLA